MADPTAVSGDAEDTALLILRAVEVDRNMWELFHRDVAVLVEAHARRVPTQHDTLLAHTWKMYRLLDEVLGYSSLPMELLDRIQDTLAEYDGVGSEREG